MHAPPAADRHIINQIHMMPTFRKTLAAFADDRCMLLSASLAFYTALSLAPALILTIWIGSLLGNDTQYRLVREISAVIGGGAGAVAEIVLENAASRPAMGTVAGTCAVLGILLGATTLFSQLQHAMNIVWNVPRRPDRNIVQHLLRKRLLSFLLLLFVIVQLLAGAAVSTALARLAGSSAAPENPYLWHVLNTLVSAIVFTLTVAAILRFFPDVTVGWRTVWLGAVITAGLLVLGKSIIGLYLTYGALGSAYGAGGALFVLLIWAHYSWAIVLLGAEFTQVWASAHGHRIIPKGAAPLCRAVT